MSLKLCLLILPRIRCALCFRVNFVEHDEFIGYKSVKFFCKSASISLYTINLFEYKDVRLIPLPINDGNSFTLYVRIAPLSCFAFNQLVRNQWFTSNTWPAGINRDAINSPAFKRLIYCSGEPHRTFIIMVINDILCSKRIPFQMAISLIVHISYH